MKTNLLTTEVSQPTEQSELQLQAECFQYAWNTFPKTRKKLWHVTNEMKPYPGERKGDFQKRISQAKAAGLVPGVSDLHFQWKGQLHVFELKVGYNKLSRDQEQFRDAIIEEGGKFYEVRDFQMFKILFLSILNT